MTAGLKQTRNTYKYMLQAGVVAALSFITLPIYTRILSPEEFGHIALAQVYAVLIISIANFGFNEAVERNYFEYKDNLTRQGQLLFTTIFFVAFLSIILISVSYVFMEPISSFLKMQKGGNIILWALVGQAIASINIYYFMFLKNNAEASRFTIYSIIVAFVNAIVGIYFVTYIKTGPVGVFYALAISGIVGGIFLTIIFVKKYKVRMNYTVFTNSFNIAYPLTPRILVGTLSSQLDKYLISLLNTMGTVGIYAVAQRISYFVFYFMTVLQNVFVPEVYKRLFSDDTSKPKEIGAYLTNFLYISTLFALSVVLFSHEIVFYLLGSAYIDSATVISILSVFYAIQFPGKVTGKQLVYAKKTSLISILSMIFLAVSLMIMIPLVKFFGAVGAAWGALISGALSNFVTFLVAQRYYKIDWQVGKMLVMYLILLIGLLIVLTSEHKGVLLSLISVKVGVLLMFILYGIIIGIINKKNSNVLLASLLKRSTE